MTTAARAEIEMISVKSSAFQSDPFRFIKQTKSMKNEFSNSYEAD